MSVVSSDGSAARPRLDEGAAPWRRPRGGTLFFLGGLALLAPWVLVRFGNGNFYLHLIIIFFYYAVVTQSWNLIMGVSGIYSFAQIALFAVGAWTTGVLAFHYGWSPFLSVWLAPIAAAVVAVLIGIPTLRLRGVYVVLLTLAFHELLRNYFTNGPFILSGGGYGLKFVPRFDFGGLPGGNPLIWYFYAGFLLFAAATYAIWRVFHSPLGLAFTALRDSETYAVGRGIDQFRMRLFLFGFSAFFTGLAGAFATHYAGSASTQIFNFSILISFLAMIVIGGWGSFGGPILGAALLIALDEWLRELGDLRTLAIGLALATIAVVAPQGLFPLIRDAVRRFFGPEEEAPGPGAQAVEGLGAEPTDTVPAETAPSETATAESASSDAAGSRTSVQAEDR